MKRIAWISDHASPLAALGGADSGGQNVYVGQVAKHLAALGYEVDVFTRRDRADLPAVTGWAGMRIIHVSAGPPTPVRKENLLPFMGDFAAQVIRFCRHERSVYDLVHANFFMSALVAMKIKRVLGTPFVVTFHALGRVRRLHQQEADAFPLERLEIEERAVAEAKAVIAECPQDRDDLIRHYGADGRALRTIPCGYDPNEFSPGAKSAARARLGLPAHEPIVLQLGRLVPRKGVDNVISGVARLWHNHRLNARLLIVGGESRVPDPVRTPEIGRLRALADAEGIADSVTFVGSRGRKELGDYYRAADVFVTTPWYEPFGITPVEAMACGTPVIGSAVGGIQWTVRDRRTGFLIPPRDPDALADRLAQLLKDEDLQRRFSANAVRRARAYFTWRQIATDTAGLYEDIWDAPHAAIAHPLENLRLSTASAEGVLRE